MKTKRSLIKGKRKRHNNRKMTRGRISFSQAAGGRRGYVPNYIIRNEKLLGRYEEELQRLKNLPATEKIDKLETIAFFEHLIRKTETKLTKLKRYREDVTKTAKHN